MPTPKVIDEKTVEYVARLSRIELTHEEIRRYCTQLEAILTYIAKLNEVDSSNISPTTHPLDNLQNVFRKDKTHRSLAVEKALQNAPHKDGKFFIVPRVIE